MSSKSFHQLKVKDIRQETADCVSVAFEIPPSLEDIYRFIPGQYLTLKATIADLEIRRSYSICSSPCDHELRVAIKQVEGGKFSTFANNNLAIGDSIEVMPPMGNFICKTDTTKANHYIAFVAGSGITPVLSIMKNMLKQEPNSHFTLIYGNKNRASIIFKEQIETLKNKYMNRLTVHHVFTREKLDAPLFNGRIDKEKVEIFCEKLISLANVDEIFICGPEEMIVGLRSFFIDENKWSQSKVNFELFSSPDQPKTVNKAWEAKQQHIDTSKTCHMTVKLDGSAIDFPLAYGGDNILDAALQQGADLPYACKGGVCSTCKAKVIEGSVDMEVNYSLEPDEIEKGFILTCQAHPRSERVIVDFDTK